MSTLFVNATIITVDDLKTIWLDGAILIDGDRIGAIGKTATLLCHPSLRDDCKIVDCQGKIILPGLINTHAHLGQSILRGLAEDVPLHSWLCDAIWPLEANYEDDDGYIASKMTIAEMLKSGSTCFLEALLTPGTGFENAARAVDEMGIRGCLGKLVKVEESDKFGMRDPRDRDISNMSIEAALAAYEKYHGSCSGRLHVWMAAGTPRGTAESAHKAIGDACCEHGIGFTMHCAEAPKDYVIYRESYFCSPVEFCHRTNIIGRGRQTVLAHMVNLDLSKDLPLLLESGATVAHNATSNCKLGSGIAAIPEMLKANINVSLGTDGAPCANTYDMIQEMRIAALIHKGSRQDAAAITAEQILTMATINGAKALGLDKEIGSLEVGKKADFVVIDPTGLHCAPFDSSQILEGGVDPVTTIVFSCSGADVDKVIVDGEVLVDGGRLVRHDEHQIRQESQRAIRRIRNKTEIRTRMARNYC
ncbi:uncharacterized protein A1O9_06681 [Exophiala aquamarina CBS 119918]|uniref:Amidohydrolase-related domain-containing protein n=1 Tax=Exophiala aquamarina CBS 119918 TaxID=1182545 RepID=A0A072PTC3_9EURO|nr:uncharacterized protein A1O9_06681 [Exophiala aquamarina CBS 119918]KEF58755.1 hypothetical protein A1O9_06681 [Exophiala aquamarina CBS 119918]